jgi:hypothetical protein
MVPRQSDVKSAETRPFDIFGSEVDVLMELNPDGKVKMICALSIPLRLD